MTWTQNVHFFTLKSFQFQTRNRLAWASQSRQTDHAPHIRTKWDLQWLGFSAVNLNTQSKRKNSQCVPFLSTAFVCQQSIGTGVFTRHRVPRAHQTEGAFENSELRNRKVTPRPGNFSKAPGRQARRKHQHKLVQGEEPHYNHSTLLNQAVRTQELFLQPHLLGHQFICLPASSCIKNLHSFA